MNKAIFLSIFSLFIVLQYTTAQALRIPQNTNIVCLTGRKIGVTEIEIRYNAPGVKGREGKIYGTGVVPFGYEVLGYGSTVASLWRAGADECTTMYFSTDVNINGKHLPAGKYAFFMEVHEDSSVLIFNKNVKEWGSYFYRKELDVLHVPTIQQKSCPSYRSGWYMISAIKPIVRLILASPGKDGVSLYKYPLILNARCWKISANR